jgi:hypothetical protein
MSETMENSSDVGSPMAGATDPASFKRMSDLGTHAAGRVQGKMQRLDGGPNTPAQELGEVRQFKRADFGMPEEQSSEEPQEMVDLSQEDNQEAESEEQQPLEQEAEEAQQLDAAAKYQEWMDSVDLPEEFQDKVFWYDADGKGDMQPIRIRDIPNNIMMYRDYQRKTSETAARNRYLDQLAAGHKKLSEDIGGQDPEAAMRAWRYMGGMKNMRAIVMAYVKEQAEIESMPPGMQQRFYEDQRIRDENFMLKREQQMAREQAQREQAEREQAQGVEAPDIQFVTKHILESLPAIYQALRIDAEEYESPAFSRELDQVFEEAAAGIRNADGTWRRAPVMKRYQTPSPKLLQQLVLETKQRVDKLITSRGKRLNPPKRKAPPTLQGTGPAAKPGQRGNMGAPQRMRWSDMGKK